MLITALDIGTSRIKVLIAEEKRDGRLALVKILKPPSAGLRKGAIVDQDDAVRAVGDALAKIRAFSKSAAKQVYINIGGADIKSQPSRGIVAVSRPNSEIFQDDVDRVVHAAQSINLASNRSVIHSDNRQFIVDSVGDIVDPIGMIGSRLEVDALVIEAFTPSINLLTKCVKMSGAKIGGMIFNPLAASRAVLSKNQKELGVMLLDIGGGSTTLSVYEENKLLHTAALPVGANNITNDIAIGLKISIEAAEAIKLSFGHALAREVSSKDGIDLKKLDPGAKSIIARRYLSEIIEVRLAELFEFADGELKKVSKNRQLPAGVVLTGGGAKLPGIADLAKQELKLPAQIGIPDPRMFEIGSPDMAEDFEDPELAVVAGLVLWGKDLTYKGGGGSVLNKLPFGNFIRYFMP